MSVFVPHETDILTLDETLFQAPVRSVALMTLGISVYLLEVTPKLAELWLKTKHRNRSIHLVQLNKIKRSLEQGRWEINGETIIFDAHGHLIEGQHRCQGVLDTGVALWSLVVHGIDQERFKTMGQGSKRSAGDILGIRGERNSRQLAAALRWVWRYENDMMMNPHPPITDDELADTIFDHQEIVTSIMYGSQKGIPIAPGLATAMHYLFHQHKPELANHFFRGFANGANLADGDPILTLRNTLLKRSAQRQVIRDERKAPMLIMAWNMLRKTPERKIVDIRPLIWRPTIQPHYPKIL